MQRKNVDIAFSVIIENGIVISCQKDFRLFKFSTDTFFNVNKKSMKNEWCFIHLFYDEKFCS